MRARITSDTVLTQPKQWSSVITRSTATLLLAKIFVITGFTSPHQIWALVTIFGNYHHWIGHGTTVWLNPYTLQYSSWSKCAKHSQIQHIPDHTLIPRHTSTNRPALPLVVVYWPGTPHGTTEANFEGDARCKRVDDRLFEGARSGISGGRGKEEDNVEGHRVELGPHQDIPKILMIVY